MANIYFYNAVKDDNTAEHTLYSGATDEIVEIYGRNFSYLKKTLVNPSYVLGEDTLLAFNSAITVTMLIENYEEYSGDGDVFAKFGLTIDDRLTLVVQQDRFNTLIGSKPEIGDLIYYPVGNNVFKVNFVNLDDSFHQFLGTNMSYRIECILYKFSHETLNTGITEVDSIAAETDSNTSTEYTELTTAAAEIVDFDTDVFGNR